MWENKKRTESGTGSKQIDIAAFSRPAICRTLLYLDKVSIVCNNNMNRNTREQGYRYRSQYPKSQLLFPTTQDIAPHRQLEATAAGGVAESGRGRWGVGNGGGCSIYFLVGVRGFQWAQVCSSSSLKRRFRLTLVPGGEDASSEDHGHGAGRSRWEYLRTCVGNRRNVEVQNSFFDM